MSFLSRVLGRGCLHRFSWPRADVNGYHYQICLMCGAAYEYDWKMMRRTNHLLAPLVSSTHKNSPTVSATTLPR